MAGLVEHTLVYWLNDGTDEDEVVLGKKQLKKLMEVWGPSNLSFRIREDLNMVIAKAVIPLVPKMEISYYAYMRSADALKTIQPISDNNATGPYKVKVIVA